MPIGSSGSYRTKKQIFESEKKRVKKFLRKHPDVMNEIIIELRNKKIKKLM